MGHEMVNSANCYNTSVTYSRKKQYAKTNRSSFGNIVSTFIFTSVQKHTKIFCASANSVFLIGKNWGLLKTNVVAGIIPGADLGDEVFCIL